MKTRYLPSRELPPYAFIPGKFPHPEKEGGHMEGVEVEVEAIDPLRASDNEDFLFGIDLFNHGYFWESHVWWEALWNEAGRKGTTADLLKGLIKIAAAGVKYNLDQKEACNGHIQRGLELFEIVREQEGDEFCSLSLTTIIDELKAIDVSSDFKFTLKLQS